MDFRRFSRIKTLLFSVREAARAFHVTPAAARLTCHRYAKKGWLLRPKRDVYLVRDRWDHLTQAEKFEIANRLQVPSYISLTTALSFHGVTTQLQQNFVESVAVTRTKDVTAGGLRFRYVKIREGLYWGFAKSGNFFMAAPEKSFLDSLYLMSLGRYRLDVSAIDRSKMDGKMLERYSRRFPEPTADLFRKIWKA